MSAQHITARLVSHSDFFCESHSCIVLRLRKGKDSVKINKGRLQDATTTQMEAQQVHASKGKQAHGVLAWVRGKALRRLHAPDIMALCHIHKWLLRSAFSSTLSNVPDNIYMPCRCARENQPVYAKRNSRTTTAAVRCCGKR